MIGTLFIGMKSGIWSWDTKLHIRYLEFVNAKLELSSAHVKIQRETDEKYLGCLELLGGGL